MERRRVCTWSASAALEPVHDFLLRLDLDTRPHTSCVTVARAHACRVESHITSFWSCHPVHVTQSAWSLQRTATYTLPGRSKFCRCRHQLASQAKQCTSNILAEAFSPSLHQEHLGRSQLFAVHRGCSTASLLFACIDLDSSRLDRYNWAKLWIPAATRDMRSMSAGASDSSLNFRQTQCTCTMRFTAGLVRVPSGV
jgi:hypothetical protein